MAGMNHFKRKLLRFNSLETRFFLRKSR